MRFDSGPPNPGNDADGSDRATDPDKTIVEPRDEPETAGRAAPWRDMVQPGQFLADRFLVTRFLGSGGMGEVFEATDQTLAEQVALKVVRAGAESSEQEKRLRREVQLARKVTHRNVCRIFDLFQHRNAETGTVFDLISMELLNGETLKEHQMQRGRLPARDALPILRQVARGLHAAHSLGIVHRDLKPGNVMLEIGRDSGLRAAITDFGLAKRVGIDAPLDASITGEGALVGSPGYIAPEQLADEGTSVATDIYSLGIMLFELLTGELPFHGSSPLMIALSRLQEAPTSLESLLPDVDPLVRAVVERCLQRQPGDRFQSAIELLDMLDRGDPSWDAFGRKRSDDDLPREPASSESPSVEPAAPTPIPVAAGDLPPTSPADTVADAVTKDEPRVDSAPTPASWKRFLPWVAVLVLAAGITAVAGWRSEVAEPATDGSGSAPPAESNVRIEDSPRVPLSGDQIADRERALEEAAERLSIFDGVTAQKILRAALEVAPADPWLESSLAQALWRSGREEDARETIARALATARDLPRHDQLFVGALHQGLFGDWAQARASLESLWQEKPGLDVGLWLLEATEHTGRRDTLPELLERLRGLPATDDPDPRVDLWEVRVQLHMDNADAARELARQTADAVQDRGAPHLAFEAQAEFFEASLQAGDPKGLNQTLSAMDHLARELEDPYLRARVERAKGRNLSRLGRGHEALIELGSAQAGFEQLGSNRGMCVSGISFAETRFLNPGEGIPHLNRSLEACQRGGFALETAETTRHLARMFRNDGQIARAKELFQDCIRQMAALGNHRGVADSLNNLSVILVWDGRLDEALKRLEQARDSYRKGPLGRGYMINRAIAADTAIEAGKLPQASVWLAEAESFDPTGTDLGLVYTAKAKLAATRADLDSLRPATVALRQHARALTTAFTRTSADGYEATVLRLEGRWDEAARSFALIKPARFFGGEIVRFYHVTGRHEEAKEALEEFATWVAAMQQKNLDWLLEVLRAQVQPGSSRAATVERLQAIEREAESLGSRLVAVHAAIAAAELLRDRALMLQARDRAASLQFNLLAQEAQQLAETLDGR